MGYILPKGSSRYETGRNGVGDGVKQAPKVLPKLPPAVKIPRPPTQSNSPKQ
jgi:hypothetical protein